MAAAAIAIGIRQHGDRPSAPSGVQRGEEGSTFRPLHAETSPEALLFSWTAVPAAERYEVALYTADLSEVLHYSATVDTFLSIDLDGLDPESLAPWRVVSTVGGDEVARSTLDTRGGVPPPESHRSVRVLNQRTIASLPRQVSPAARTRTK